MNTFISPMWVTTDTAMQWKNNIKLVRNFDRQWNDEWSSKGGAKKGYTIQIRLPQRGQVAEGQAFVQQPILNQTVAATLNHQFQYSMSWSSADHAMLVEEVQSRYTSRAGTFLANKADVTAGLEVYKSVYFSAGPTSAINLAGVNANVTLDGAYTDAVALLRNVGVPDDLIAVIDPNSQSDLLKVAFNQFNPQAQITKYWEKGQFSGPALGVNEWDWDQNVPTHTTGTFTSSTPLVDGALQTGSTILCKGFGTYSFPIGDTFRIAGVNAVNPDSYTDTGTLQDFSIQAAVSGSGAVTFTISPPIITSGALQTVTASPANNASIFFRMSTGGLTSAANITMATQSSRQSLIFVRDAFAFIQAELPSPLAGADSVRKTDKEAKISMRWAQQWNGQTDQEISRLEMLCGICPVLPYMALRVWR